MIWTVCHCTRQESCVLILKLSTFLATDTLRVRANSRTGASIFLPHPRLVQTSLSALWRLQWGQINFCDDAILRCIMPPGGAESNV
jgi:hypothetical protein